MRNRRQRGNVFWGSIFILAAIVLVTKELGWLDGLGPGWVINPWSLIATLLLGALIIASLAHRSLIGTIFPIAFLAILYSRPLGIESLVPWTILGAACLLTIGFAILRPHYGHPWYYHHHHDQYMEEETFVYDETGQTDEIINISTQMGNTVRYLQAQNIKVVNVDNNMSTTKIYFDHAQLAETATLNLDNMMGTVELYLPAEWKIDNEINLVLSTISERGMRRGQPSQVLRLQGRSSVGNVVIVYI